MAVAGLVPNHSYVDVHRAAMDLGLERNVADLDILGYTVIDNAAPQTWFDSLRARMVEIAEEDMRDGTACFYAEGQRLWHLLCKGRVFEEAVLNERVLALITLLLGESCTVSSVTANFVREGAPNQMMHGDTAMVPDPLPPYAQVANAIWCCDEWTEENGATRVVPGSHKLCRRPRVGEAEAQAVPVTCERGSVIVTHGSLWHGGGAKSTPGIRVGLLAYFCRMYMRTQEPLLEMVPREVVDRNPPRFARLLGAHVPYGWRTNGPDQAKLGPAFAFTESIYG